MISNGKKIEKKAINKNYKNKIEKRTVFFLDKKGLLKMIDELSEIPSNKKIIAKDTVEEYIYFKEQIAKFSKLPLIRIDEKNTERQKVTPAGKLIKDYSQVVDAKRTTLLRILSNDGSTAEDELLAKLSEFE